MKILFVTQSIKINLNKSYFVILLESIRRCIKMFDSNILPKFLCIILDIDHFFVVSIEKNSYSRGNFCLKVIKYNLVNKNLLSTYHNYYINKLLPMLGTLISHI